MKRSGSGRLNHQSMELEASASRNDNGERPDWSLHRGLLHSTTDPPALIRVLVHVPVLPALFL